jgi:N-methylhydantoinase A
MPLRKDLAESALKEQIADPLGISVVEAADGIHRIVDSHMSDCIRFHAIQRGYDPREFDLLAFGGAGPMHAIGYGEELGVKSIIVPLSGVATVLSAFGIGNSDILKFYFSSVPMSLGREGIPEINRIYQEMEERGYQDMLEMGFEREEISLWRTAGMRYHLQLTELDTNIPLGKLNDESIAEIVQVFDRRYAELYGETAGYKEAGRDIITEFVRVTARTPKGKIEASGDRYQEADHALTGTRAAYFSEVGDFVETRIYDGEELQAGNRIPGPAILEMAGTTVVVTPSYTGELDRYRNIVLREKF